jgi:hypothetical protein
MMGDTFEIKNETHAPNVSVKIGKLRCFSSCAEKPIRYRWLVVRCGAMPVPA